MGCIGLLNTYITCIKKKKSLKLKKNKYEATEKAFCRSSKTWSHSQTWTEMELSLKSKFPFPGTITPSGRVLTCALLQSNPAKQPGGLQGKHARQRSDRTTANRGFCYKINIRKIWWNTSKAAGLQQNSSNPTTLSLPSRLVCSRANHQKPNFPFSLLRPRHAIALACRHSLSEVC